MDYYGLMSIVKSGKEEVELKAPTESFKHRTEMIDPFIEPTFKKEDFPKEKPTVLLISAMAASGKTTTAEALACQTNLPILDLAKHGPVSSDSLAGILLKAYDGKIDDVLKGLREGTFGVIIDGLDEGRSKARNETVFESFLDNIVELTERSPTTSIVIFGRGEPLLNTWAYMNDKGATVGLLRIDPFDLNQAKSYIDAYARPDTADYRTDYNNVRDMILRLLNSAFITVKEGDNTFLSFIGYPPVLDAIATILYLERNYFKLKQMLIRDKDNVEIGLLINICNYLIRREKEDKALPNFIDDIASDAGGEVGDELRNNLFDAEEQCARILANTLNCKFPLRRVEDDTLNERYEESLLVWVPEHPFLKNGKIRNCVFEALALSYCSISQEPKYRELAAKYSSSYKPSYHLLYLIDELSRGKTIDSHHFNMLIQSCTDFISKDQYPQIELRGFSWDDPASPALSNVDIDIDIIHNGDDKKKTFTFKGKVRNTDKLSIGPFLINTSITLPCSLLLQGKPDLDSSGVSKLSAKSVCFKSDVVVRHLPQLNENAESGLFIDAHTIEGRADEATFKGGSMALICEEHNLAHPLVKYVKIVKNTAKDPELDEKYKILRRILMSFRSHRKDRKARLCAKIDSERVSRGDIGTRVLNCLRNTGIIYKEGIRYFIDDERLSNKLRISWQELCEWKMTKETIEFLRAC